MMTSWKRAIVRVDSKLETIRETVLQRTERGWLLDSQDRSPERGCVDLTFRRAEPTGQAANG